MSEFRIKVLIFMIPLLLPVGRMDISPADQSQGDAESSRVSHAKDQGSSPDAELISLLDQIESAAKQVDTLKANIRYDRIQGLLGDRQRRFGTLVYQAGPPPRFDARFDRLIVDQTMRPIDRRYIFDGRWFARKNGKEKTFERRELVPPPSEGGTKRQARDSTTLGAGPFVLPLDTDKQDILRKFHVKKIAPAEDDPKGTFHLRLTPRKQVRIDHTQIDIWYDRENDLPRRVATLDDSKNRSVIEMLNLQVNPDLEAHSFDTSPPEGDQWTVQTIPYEQRSNGM